MRSTAAYKSWNKTYSIYVLVVLMVVYTMSQADRFVLGITSYHISHDLEIGHQVCYTNDTDGICNTINCSSYTDQETCNDANEGCLWDYTDTSIYYQIVAGPAFLVTFAIFSLPMGFLASLPFVRRTTLLAICSLLWSIIAGLTGFTNEYWQLIMTRISLGILQSACTPFAGSIITDCFSEGSRGAALGFYSWGVYVGFSLAFAFDFVVRGLTWRWAFWIIGIGGVVCSLVALVTFREPSRATPVDDSQNKENKKYGCADYLNLLKRVFSSYLQLPLLFLCIGAGLRQGGGLVWAYNAKAYFRQLHCDVTGVGTYLSWVPVVGGSVGVFVGGWISDVLVHKWGTKSRIIVLITCSFIASPFLIGTLYSPLPWAFLCLLLAYIAGEMWFGVCIAVAIEMVPPDIASSSLALYMFVVNNIGGTLNLTLPPLERSIGLQMTMVVLYPGMYIASGIFFAIAGLLLVYRRRPSCRGNARKVGTEREGLIQNFDDEQLSSLLTESQEIQRRRSKRTSYGIDSSIQQQQPDFRYSLSLTASI